MLLDIDGGHLRAKPQIDVVLRIELRWSKRNPLLRCRTRKIVLREIGAVVRGGLVRADDGERAAETLAAQHLGGCEARRATAEDDDALTRFGRRTWRRGLVP